MYSILHLDQSQDFNHELKTTLSRSAHLTWASSLSDAKRLMASENYDMIILDLILPDGDGIDFCFSLQNSHKNTPIIVLTSLDDVSKKVSSFAAGADDYITRPFHSIELQSKIDSKLRNVSKQSKTYDLYKWKEIEISKSKQEMIVYHQYGEQRFELTAMEFKILCMFSNLTETVLSRDMILNEIWGDDVYVAPRSVDTHISKLRRKLGDKAHVIQSVHGTGYMFCPTSLQIA